MLTKETTSCQIIGADSLPETSGCQVKRRYLLLRHLWRRFGLSSVQRLQTGNDRKRTSGILSRNNGRRYHSLMCLARTSMPREIRMLTLCMWGYLRKTQRRVETWSAFFWCTCMGPELRRTVGIANTQGSCKSSDLSKATPARASSGTT